MTAWAPVAATTADARPVSISLPPGWSVLRTAAADLDGQVGRLLAAALPQRASPGLRAELGEEWRRVARVAAAGGAVLLGFGAALGDAGDLVTASLLLAPHRWYPDGDDEVGLDGPCHRLTVPSGAAVRSLHVVARPSPIGDVAELVVRYTIEQGGRAAWSLVFRTPSLGRMTELVAVFDGVAASLRVPDEPADADDGPVFS